MNRLLLGFLAGLLGLPVAAYGQYPGYRPGGYPNPYYPNPYYGGNPGAGYNRGAALSGSADVQRAYGDVIVKQEESRVVREQANQAKLDTKKKAFDQMLYEKANTPTPLQDLTTLKGQTLTRIMNFPSKSEITNGTTLNYMLPPLQMLSAQGTQGPPVPIAQSMVNQLNIVGTASGSVAVLRDGGRVDWSPDMRGPQQAKLDKLLPAAYEATLANKLDAKLLRQIRTELTSMRESLRQQLKKEEIETTAYIQAIAIYNSLESAVNALSRPDARKQLAGAYSPRARNVQELIDFMTDNGLKFAASTPGQENAYQVTHDAFVRYLRTAQSSSGFTAMNSPVRPAGGKN